MSPWALGTAWALSVGSLSVSLPSDSAAGVLSRTVLCVLPWLALAGLPQGTTRTADSGCSLWSLYALLLPLLAVALGLDYASGMEPFGLARAGFVMLALTGLYAQVSSRARGSLAHACAWTILIPLPLVLVALPELGASNSGTWFTVLAATPSGWALRELTPDPQDAWYLERDLGLVISTALFFAGSFLFREREVPR